MNAANDSHVAEPSKRPEPRKSRGERLLHAASGRSADRETIMTALAPLDSDHPVAAILGEADTVLRVALDTLEDRLDASSRGSLATPVFDMLFMLQCRLSCASLFLHEEVRDTAKPSSVDAPSSITRESAAIATEMMRTIDVELGNLAKRAEDGVDTHAEEQRVAALCADLARLQRLARTAAGVLTPAADEDSAEPMHDAEE
jgi:hypothetical protein